jgi:hypothetical protein
MGPKVGLDVVPKRNILSRVSVTLDGVLDWGLDLLTNYKSL